MPEKIWFTGFGYGFVPQNFGFLWYQVRVLVWVLIIEPETDTRLFFGCLCMNNILYYLFNITVQFSKKTDAYKQAFTVITVNSHVNLNCINE